MNNNNQKIKQETTQNNNNKRNTLKLTRIGIEKIINNRWLLIIPTIYMIIASICWKYRDYIYKIIPFDTNFKFFYIEDLMIKSVIGILLFLILWLIIVTIGTIGTGKYDEDFEEQGFVNKKGLPPDRISEKNNSKEIEHSVKWDFLASNIPINTWKDNILKVEQVLDAYINYLEYSKLTKKHVIIKGVPTKYYKPAILTTRDNFLCDSFNAVFVGPTGSGKSYAVLSFMGKIALHNPSNTCTYLCDPKGDEQNFMQFEGSPHYYLGIEKSVDGINKFYDEFVYRRDSRDKERKKQLAYLVVDEYSMLLSSLDDARAKEVKRKIGEMLRAGRSLSCRVIIGLQNAYSEFFDKSRDNLVTRIALSTISKEEQGMMFSKYKEKMIKEFGQGEGYIYRSGIGLEELFVAKIENMEEVNSAIKKSLSNEFGSY